ncbi:MAG TPA: S8 family peptidase [Vicinamibacterales bacterium]|nr:S8 family peptidase [Vicinamibacterales bacterium]
MALLVAVLAMPAIAAHAQPPAAVVSKLDARLAATIRNGDSITQRVIIRTTAEGIPGLTRALERSNLAVLRRHLIINAVTARVPVAALEGLARLPFVQSISSDAVVIADQTTSADSTLRGTLALPVQAPAGNRVAVAVIDSGLEPGPEFGDRIAGFYDFTQDGRAASPTDDYGHGTHVAGLIAGSGDLSSGKRYRGVAPKARVVALKVLDRNGAGTTSNVISAIEFVTANKERFGLDIINLSLGHPVYEPAATDPLVQAVEAAVRAGLVVVVSAGNYGLSSITGLPGYAGILSPANAPSAITVGSVKSFETNTRADDRVAPYSSRGPTWYDGGAKPDLVAPGHGLVAAGAKSGSLYINNPALRVSDAYLRLSGTSMAAAVVSGTVALIVEANRAAFPTASLRPNAVKGILQYTALPVRDERGSPYDYLTQGAGSVNPAGAIELASRIDPLTPLGSWWLTTRVDEWTVIDGQTLPWAHTVAWGDALSDGPALYYNELAWTQNIIWGSNIVWGNDITWDDNIIWGSDIVWDDNIIWGSSLISTSDGTSVSWGPLDGRAESIGSVLTSP